MGESQKWNRALNKIFQKRKRSFSLQHISAYPEPGLSPANNKTAFPCVFWRLAGSEWVHPQPWAPPGAGRASERVQSWKRTAAGGVSWERDQSWTIIKHSPQKDLKSGSGTARQSEIQHQSQAGRMDTTVTIFLSTESLLWRPLSLQIRYQIIPHQKQDTQNTLPSYKNPKNTTRCWIFPTIFCPNSQISQHRTSSLIHKRRCS